MKIEKLSNNNLKRGVIFGIMITLVFIVIINLLISYSKYKIEQNINLATGTINHTIPDLNALAVYVKEGESFVKQDTIPKGYYTVSSNSYCTIPNSEDQIKNKITYNINGTVSIDINVKGTKCWVYLEKANVTNVTDLKNILSNQTPKDCSSVTGVATEDEGICTTEDYDYQTTYAYRGASEYNYVKFANYYWRIIRINGDGSLRLIYDGTSAHANGTTEGNGLDRQIEENGMGYNTIANDAKYVGFKFGNTSGNYDEATTNTNNSTMLDKLETWYRDNLAIYDNDIEKDAIFCNDRRSIDNFDDSWADWIKAGSVNKQGYGKNETAYGSRMRIYFTGSIKKGFQPTQYVDLSCQPNDRFTSINATGGNKSMQYPIGLITLTEVLMAGGFGGQVNDKYYLYTGQYYWTMSPSDFFLDAGGAQVYRVEGNTTIHGAGHYLSTNNTTFAFGVKPVINLKANTPFISGDGSMSSPFVVN